MLQILLFVLTLSVGTITYAEAPVQEYIQPKTSWTQSEAKELVDYYADKYKISRATLHFVINCESGYRYNAVNWQDSHRLSQGSHGIAQFSRETFNHYKKFVNENYSDPYHPEQALDVTAYMISVGQGRHWTCYRKITSL